MGQLYVVLLLQLIVSGGLFLTCHAEQIAATANVTSHWNSSDVSLFVDNINTTFMCIPNFNFTDVFWSSTIMFNETFYETNYIFLPLKAAK